MRATGNDETRCRAAPEVRVVEAWHASLNAGEADLLVKLSHPDVEAGVRAEPDVARGCCANG